MLIAPGLTERPGNSILWVRERRKGMKYPLARGNEKLDPSVFAGLILLLSLAQTISEQQYIPFLEYTVAKRQQYIYIYIYIDIYSL